MAAPLKDGLDYFAIDTDFLGNDKIQDILDEENCGARALMIILYVWSKTYSDKGYYFPVTDKTYRHIRKYFAFTGSLEENYIRQVISECVKGGLFDEAVFNRFGILTSPRIQKQYLKGVEKRNEIRLIKEYFLLDDKDIPKGALDKIAFNSVNGGNNGVNVGINSVNSSDYPQSKVKESKVKNSKNIPPSVDAVREYCLERKNGIDPEEFIDFYAAKNWYIGKNKMTDWKACVRTWEKKRKQEAPKESDASYNLDEYKKAVINAPLKYERRNK